MRRWITGCFWLYAGWVSPASGQEVRGLVLEEFTYLPIELAEVTMVTGDSETRHTTLTDAEGFFSLEAPRGVFVLRVTALGYRPTRTAPIELLDESDLRVVEIPMSLAPVVIEGLEVAAEHSALAGTGFYERMAAGRGQFLTPEDIATSDARFTPELFYDLDHVMRENMLPVWQRSIQYMSATQRGNCYPRIYIDGVWWRWRAPGEGLMDAVPLEDLVGAEVFWGPFQAPLRYQGTTIENSCGVVLLWTRYGRR